MNDNEPIETVAIEAVHTDDAALAAIKANELPPTIREPKPYTLMTVDLPWPEKGETSGYLDIPQPADFVRAYRYETRNRITSRVEYKIRTVWLAANGGELYRLHVLLQREGASIRLAGDDADAQLLELMIGPNGESLALWRLPFMTKREAAPAEETTP